MAVDLTPPVPPSGEPARHSLPATPATCYWGYLDRDQPPCLKIDSGDIVHVEAITHHAGDDATDKGFGSLASPLFGFDFTARPIYDLPGVISEPDGVGRRRPRCHAVRRRHPRLPRSDRPLDLSVTGDPRISDVLWSDHQSKDGADHTGDGGRDMPITRSLTLLSVHAAPNIDAENERYAAVDLV